MRREIREQFLIEPRVRDGFKKEGTAAIGQLVRDEVRWGVPISSNLAVRRSSVTSKKTISGKWLGQMSDYNGMMTKCRKSLSRKSLWGRIGRGRKKTGKAEMESMNARKKIGTTTRGNKAKDWLPGCRRKAGCRWQPSQGVNLGPREKRQRRYGIRQSLIQLLALALTMWTGANNLISALQILRKYPQKEHRLSKNTPTVNMIRFSEFFPSYDFNVGWWHKSKV